jgi:hypothetical protein
MTDATPLPLSRGGTACPDEPPTEANRYQTRCARVASHRSSRTDRRRPSAQQTCKNTPRLSPTEVEMTATPLRGDNSQKSMSVGRLTIVRSIQLKSSTVRPTSSGWRATCSRLPFLVVSVDDDPQPSARGRHEFGLDLGQQTLNAKGAGLHG